MRRTQPGTPDGLLSVLGDSARLDAVMAQEQQHLGFLLAEAVEPFDAFWHRAQPLRELVEQDVAFVHDRLPWE
jgi:hypothetical protein